MKNHLNADNIGELEAGQMRMEINQAIDSGLRDMVERPHVQGVRRMTITIDMEPAGETVHISGTVDRKFPRLKNEEPDNLVITQKDGKVIALLTAQEDMFEPRHD